MFSTRQLIFIGFLLVGFGSLALVGAVVRGNLGRTFICATAVYLAFAALQQNLERLRKERAPSSPPSRGKGGRPTSRGE